MSVVLYEYADQFTDIFTNSVDYVNKLPSQRFIKTHLPFQLLPTEIHKVKPKIIYTMRHPKDLCVSYYYHCKLLHGFNVEFETFCELFLNDSTAYGGLFNHYREFWSRRHEDNILVLKYEDMKKDTRSMVKTVSHFMGKTLSDEEVDSLLEFLQFNKMKENSGCNFENILDPQLILKKMGIVRNTNELDEVLKRDFTSVFREGYINVKGVTMPKRFEDMENDIYEWNVREEDVWICSFPKTGTTWVQEMVWMIMNDLDFEEGQINLGARSPFLEVAALFDYRTFKKQQPDFVPPPFIDDSLKFVKNAEKNGPLCLKTHLPWILLPKEIQENTKQPKMIYVTRNPKDTCISYYNHCRLMEGYKGNFEDFCKLFLAGKLNFAPYWDHIIPFWHKRHQSNVLFIKYEDMIKDLPAIIRRVAKFLEKLLTDEQVVTLTEHLSFSTMKNNPAVNYEMVVGLNRKFNIIDCEGTFMRSGKVGDFKAKMTPEIIKRFDEWTELNLKTTGFAF